MYREFRYIVHMKSKLIQGSLETIILELISRQGEMYGYEIVQKVTDLSNGGINITEGALYPALHKMTDKDLLQTEIRSIGNRKRKYYRLTHKGKELTAEKVSQMKTFIENLNSIFNPQIATYGIAKN